MNHHEPIATTNNQWLIITTNHGIYSLNIIKPRQHMWFGISLSGENDGYFKLEDAAPISGVFFPWLSSSKGTIPKWAFVNHPQIGQGEWNLSNVPNPLVFLTYIYIYWLVGFHVGWCQTTVYTVPVLAQHKYHKYDHALHVFPLCVHARAPIIEQTYDPKSQSAVMVTQTGSVMLSNYKITKLIPFP